MGGTRPAERPQSAPSSMGDPRPKWPGDPTFSLRCFLLWFGPLLCLDPPPSTRAPVSCFVSRCFLNVVPMALSLDIFFKVFFIGV